MYPPPSCDTRHQERACSEHAQADRDADNEAFIFINKVHVARPPRRGPPVRIAWTTQMPLRGVIQPTFRVDNCRAVHLWHRRNHDRILRKRARGYLSKKEVRLEGSHLIPSPTCHF